MTQKELNALPSILRTHHLQAISEGGRKWVEYFLEKHPEVIQEKRGRGRPTTYSKEKTFQALGLRYE